MTRDEALKTLGLGHTASPEEIRRKYRSLCHEWHPDHFSGAEKKEKATRVFLRIRDAYEYFKSHGHWTARAEANNANNARRPYEPDAEMEEKLAKFRAEYPQQDWGQSERSDPEPFSWWMVLPPPLDLIYGLIKGIFTAKSIAIRILAVCALLFIVRIVWLEIGEYFPGQ